MLKAALVTDSSIDATECSPGRVSHTARPADVRTQAGDLRCAERARHEPMGNGLLTANRAVKDRGKRG